MTVDPPRRFISLRLLIRKDSSLFIDYEFPEQTQRHLQQCGMCGCDGERPACDIIVGLLVGLGVLVPCLFIWCMYACDRRAYSAFAHDACPCLVREESKNRVIRIPIVKKEQEKEKEKEKKAE
jgi:hypothetical protein